MNKMIITAAPVALAILLSGCGSKSLPSDTSADSSVTADAADLAERTVRNLKLDPLILVNSDNPIPDYWDNEVPLVMTHNSLGESLAVEKNTYKAYLELKDALEGEGVYIDIASAYRSIIEQENYILNHPGEAAEQPGISENHTGFALDLYLNIGGSDITDKAALQNETDTWARVHEKLPEYGFILRYPEGKESITGHSYEPWHIRYVGSPDTARDITDKGETLEEYSGAA